MTSSGGLAAGLAYLPNWLADAREGHALDALLSGWVRASGWKSAGVVWPFDSGVKLAVLAREDGVEPLAHPPAETADVAESLRSGTPTVVWQVPNSAGRLYTLLVPAGRPAGVLWAERPAGEPWTEADRNYLRLSAKLIERSSALSARIGPVVDPDRLQQRLHDAAVIAGRMAHDFDNILTGVIGFADLTAPLLPAGSQPHKFVGEIGKVGQRGMVFTQQLHQLSRSGQVKPQPAAVAAALTKEETRLKAVLPAGARIVTDVPAGLAAVGMDAGPLGVVVGHLLENAVEATPANGTVTVTVRQVELNPSDARLYLGQVGPGAYAEITVTDGGPGIKPEVRAKLFVEPFYTTKVRHRGLGLAVVYRTLFAHRGGIRIDAAAPPAPGTVARVVIPLAAARPAVAPAAAVGLSNFGG